MSKVIRTARVAEHAVTLGLQQQDLYLGEEEQQEESGVDLVSLLEAKVDLVRKELTDEADARVSEEHETMRAAAERQQEEAEQRHTEEVARVHEQRYEEGYQAGVGAKEEEARAAVSRLEALHDSLKRVRNQVLTEAETLVVDLAASLARKVTGVQAETDKTVLIRVAREALARFSESSDLVIMVNADDQQVARRFAEKWVEKVDEDAVLRIISSDQVERGGCMIKGVEENVDARLEQQLQVLADELKASVMTRSASREDPDVASQGPDPGDVTQTGDESVDGSE